MSNAIVTENLNTGTTAWQITQPTNTLIQGYVSACSVDPGGSLNVYVSTSVASVGYSIYVYRMGYYGGTGGRLMQSVTGQVGVAQGYYDPVGLTLNNCPTAFVDGTTGLVEARWASSYTLAIGSNWVTGLYLVQFVDANGYQSYSHFVVRPPTTTQYVAVHADMTNAAYNSWGGKSLYTYNSTSGVAATKVSFDRPSTEYRGAGYLLLQDINFIKWAEHQGYDLGYLSDVDVHATSTILSGHSAVLSLGHDEYWSYEKRATYEAARASGIGLAFLGGNTCWWQTRIETGGQNGANRTVTCYKVKSPAATLAPDPYYGCNDPTYHDNRRITGNWNDAVVLRPPSSLLGIGFSDLNSNALVGWTVWASTTSPYITGTGLVAGSTYGTDIVGPEWDNNKMLPSVSGLSIIGQTAMTGTNVGADVSQTTTYIGSGGALVFASGSYMFQWALDDYRYSPYPFPGSPGVGVSQIQAFMVNILAGLVATPISGPRWRGF